MHNTPVDTSNYKLFAAYIKQLCTNNNNKLRKASKVCQQCCTSVITTAATSWQVALITKRHLIDQKWTAYLSSRFQARESFRQLPWQLIAMTTTTHAPQTDQHFNKIIIIITIIIMSLENAITSLRLAAVKLQWSKVMHLITSLLHLEKHPRILDNTTSLTAINHSLIMHS